MSSDKKFGMLRGVLRTLGLSSESADQVVDFIVDLLAGEGKGESAPGPSADFPYQQREHFLSAAERSFYGVLKAAIADQGTLLCKVALGDIFYVKKGDDASQYRIYTNKIDRKHVDFLLCDSQTMQPILGFELDDGSHQREDRQARDAFVDGVFAAADLPLIHVPAKRAYAVADVEALFAPYVAAANAPAALRAVRVPVAVEPSAAGEPCCPKCGSAMILRTSKSGVTAGTQFWGCSNFPKCRGMVSYQA